MSVTAIKVAILKARKQLELFDRHDYEYNETTTRYVLIDPLVRASGWDIHDLDQCTFEWSMPRRSPIGRSDYVLWDSDDESVIVIEAKSIGIALKTRPPSIERKLAGYTRGMKRGVAVLTNGLCWHLYELDSSRRAFKNKHVAEVDIREGYGSISGAAKTLHEWLNKDRWR